MLGEDWEQSKNIMIHYGIGQKFEITRLLANFQCGLPACYPATHGAAADQH